MCPQADHLRLFTHCTDGLNSTLSIIEPQHLLSLCMRCVSYLPSSSRLEVPNQVTAMVVSQPGDTKVEMKLATRRSALVPPL